MNILMGIAIVLFAIWLSAILFHVLVAVLGLAVHLILIVAIVLFIYSLIRGKRNV